MSSSFGVGFNTDRSTSYNTNYYFSKNEINRRRDEHRKIDKEINSDIPYFIKYEDRIEKSGHVRKYFEDSVKETYFQIFIWTYEDDVIKFDLHYDMDKNEKVLSWRIQNNQFTHNLVNPEKEKDIGLKKTQNLSESIDFNWNEIAGKFKELINNTKEAKLQYFTLLEKVYSITDNHLSNNQ
ncbi:MAG: hypothetical protein CVV49_22090 [Spirochaetae bacterium HGW-Spirochaetae-5]|nr:MAG: hypothetical protein CVV49_22090 [Spirochaetae bacterium HGW-Spirochaetae-5]